MSSDETGFVVKLCKMPRPVGEGKRFSSLIAFGSRRPAGRRKRPVSTAFS